MDRSSGAGNADRLRDAEDDGRGTRVRSVWRSYFFFTWELRPRSPSPEQFSLVAASRARLAAKTQRCFAYSSGGPTKLGAASSSALLRLIAAREEPRAPLKTSTGAPGECFEVLLSCVRHRGVGTIYLSDPIPRTPGAVRFSPEQSRTLLNK